MSEIAIKVEGIGKKYRIGRKKSGDMRGAFLDFLQQLTSRSSNSKQVKDTKFEALKDISFDVKKGDAMGIIGRNGAGKSTLLKILSRITKPSFGRFEINGRVSSLLEVGTGFHPELTGRENIFLNGTILGLRRAEIKARLEQIVGFSGVEEFIDTPVKHYSSGMNVRLAFSVAAHLEPEILIIDEVLAVGDAEFQKKCLGKMEDVAGQGRTVLFVSHNMAAVKNLCKTGLLIDRGRLIFNGDIHETVSKYQNLHLSGRSNNQELLSTVRARGEQKILFKSINFGENPYKYGSSIAVNVTILNNLEIISEDIDLAIAINNAEGLTVIHCCNRFQHQKLTINQKEENYVFTIEQNLRPGNYFVTLFLRINGIIQDWLDNVGTFTITESSPYPHNNLSEIQGIIFPRYDIRRVKNNDLERKID